MTVTVWALTRPAADPASGATASVSIITSTANAAVTVPTSAVHLLGGSAFVTVLLAGKTQNRRVEPGVVVLADLSQALPTSNTNVRGLVGGGQRGR